MSEATDPAVARWHGLMTALMRQSELSVRELAARTGYSSTYCNEATNGTRIPPWHVAEAVITALGDGAEARLPAWRAAREACGLSTGKNADDGPPGAPPRGRAEVPPGTPAPGDPRSAPAPGPVAPAPGPPVRPVPSGPSRAPWFRRQVLVPACVAAFGVIAALSYLVVAGHPAGHRDGAGPPRPGRTPGQSQSAGSSCRTTRQYLVTSDGAVLDAHGTPLGGGIHRGDYFDLSPDQPHNPYSHRYYGSVVERDLAGYVDQAKLHLTGTVCLPPRR